jgi:hypothetical protein
MLIVLSGADGRLFGQLKNKKSPNRWPDSTDIASCNSEQEKTTPPPLGGE